MSDLIIHGESEQLEQLLRDLEREVGAEANPYPITSGESGEPREPVLIALIVALSPVVVKVIKRYMQHVETMDKQETERLKVKQDHQLQLAILHKDDSEEPVAIDDLPAT
jgi:hypothetical protein